MDKFEIRKRDTIWNPVTQQVDETHICFVATEREAKEIAASNPRYVIRPILSNEFTAQRIAGDVMSLGPYS